MPSQALSNIPSVSDVGYGGVTGYIAGQCTAFVADFMSKFGVNLPSHLGNAAQWNASEIPGASESNTPQLGDIAVFGGGYPGSGGAGHVGVVSQINTSPAGQVTSFDILQGNALGTNVAGSTGNWETETQISSNQPDLQGFINVSNVAGLTGVQTSNGNTSIPGGTYTPGSSSTTPVLDLNPLDVFSGWQQDIKNWGIIVGLVILGLVLILGGFIVSKPGQKSAGLALEFVK